MKMVKYIKTVLILLLICLTVRYSVFAETGSGGQPGSFLRIGIGGKALGMGKAFTSIANNSDTVYWNPAGLCRLASKHQAGLTYSEPFSENISGVKYMTATYGGRKDKFGWGLGIINHSVSGIPEIDLSGNRVGTYDSVDTAVLGAFSYPFANKLSAGMTAKLISRHFYKYDKTTGDLDLGLLWNPQQKLRIGLSLQNFLKSDISLTSYKENMPLFGRLGVSFRFIKQMIVACETDWVEGQNEPKVSFGTELDLMEELRIRGGYSGISKEYLMGIGLSISKFVLDYTFSSHSLGTSHIFSLTINI